MVFNRGVISQPTDGSQGCSDRIDSEGKKTMLNETKPTIVHTDRKINTLLKRKENASHIDVKGHASNSDILARVDW